MEMHNAETLYVNVSVLVTEMGETRAEEWVVAETPDVPAENLAKMLVRMSTNPNKPKTLVLIVTQIVKRDDENWRYALGDRIVQRELTSKTLEEVRMRFAPVSYL